MFAYHSISIKAGGENYLLFYTHTRRYAASMIQSSLNVFYVAGVMFGKKKMNPRESVQWKKTSLKKVIGKVKTCSTVLKKKFFHSSFCDKRQCLAVYIV